MNNSTNKPIELTAYDFRDTRKVSYVRYCSLEQELNADMSAKRNGMPRSLGFGKSNSGI